MALDHRQLKVLEDNRLNVATEYLGLWAIYHQAVEDYGLKEPYVHQFVLEIVERMMETGFLIGGFTGPQGQFTLWPSQTPQAVLERLAELWQSPREPHFGDPWFDYPRQTKAV